MSFISLFYFCNWLKFKSLKISCKMRMRMIRFFMLSCFLNYYINSFYSWILGKFYSRNSLHSQILVGIRYLSNKIPESKQGLVRVWLLDLGRTWPWYGLLSGMALILNGFLLSNFHRFPNDIVEGIPLIFRDDHF